MSQDDLFGDVQTKTKVQGCTFFSNVLRASLKQIKYTVTSVRRNRIFFVLHRQNNQIRVSCQEDIDRSVS